MFWKDFDGQIFAVHRFLFAPLSLLLSRKMLSIEIFLEQFNNKLLTNKTSPYSLFSPLNTDGTQLYPENS